MTARASSPRRAQHNQKKKWAFEKKNGLGDFVDNVLFPLIIRIIKGKKKDERKPPNYLILPGIRSDPT